MAWFAYEKRPVEDGEIRLFWTGRMTWPLPIQSCAYSSKKAAEAARKRMVKKLHRLSDENTGVMEGPIHPDDGVISSGRRVLYRNDGTVVDFDYGDEQHG